MRAALLLVNPKHDAALDRCPRCRAVLLGRGEAPCPFCIPVQSTEKLMAAVGVFEPPPRNAKRGT